MKTTEIVSFLYETWRKQCKPGDYVFLSTKDPHDKRSWKDHPIEFNRELKLQLRAFLKEYPSLKYDIYWCPLPFTGPKRDRNLVPRTKFLWQDLDYADPKDFPEFIPSIYWESSPKRYHGLWELDKVYSSDQVEGLNRDLAYHVGADKGGWDLTQVLRIPGTHNHKYADKPEIKFKRKEEDKYKLSQLRSKIPEQRKLDLTEITDIEEGNVQEIMTEWSKKLPKKVLSLLLQEKANVGERSDTIWYLENKLYEAGLTPEEIFTLIKHSAWNKYKGRHDENERLQKEMSKIISQAGTEATQEALSSFDINASGIEIQVDSYRDLMGNMSSLPGWLVEGFWARRSHGIVAGEPKSFKSTYVMDLALSVASGKPFLGKYPVLEPGPVIYIQNENADWILKDKLEKMMVNKKLDGAYRRRGDREIHIRFPKDLPFYFINQQGFQLNDPIHQKILEDLVAEVKPVLVILDPLYLMFDGDMNSAKDLNPILTWMLKIKNDFKTGVMAIHHYNKGGNSWRGGQRMLGSATLHGWIESAWYLQRTEPDQDEEAETDKQSKIRTSVILDREFRNAGHFPKLELSLLMGELGSAVYDVESDIYREEESTDKGKRRKKSPEELGNEIEEILVQNGTNTMSILQLKNITGASDKDLKAGMEYLTLQKGGFNRGEGLLTKL